MIVDKVKKNDLCLGCGLCSSILGKEKCRMILENSGFYKPEVVGMVTKSENTVIKHICPAIRVEGPSHKGEWGNIEKICVSWSTDGAVRRMAASGGVVSSLAIYLLEKGKVDAVLQVGVNEDSYLYNSLKISRTKDDVKRNAQSRYAPALVFHNLKGIFDSCSDVFAFIGKPCDIAGLKNFVAEFPEYKSRIKLYISIFCAGMPSYNATKKLWMQSGHADEPVSLKYRGDGWPGYFKAKWNDGSEYQLSYNDSWGKVLGKNLCFRCKICPDGIGMLADIAVGDAWETKNGYPDFTEAEGKSFCMLRTRQGVELFDDAVNQGYLENRSLDISKIREMQSYQYERRKMTGWRIIPVQLLSGFLLKFKGLNIFSQAKTANLKRGVKNCFGTFCRIIKK